MRICKFDFYLPARYILYMKWLTEELKEEVKSIFEPRYKRNLSNQEVIEIAQNLASGLETLFKFKWRKKYEKPTIQN